MIYRFMDANKADFPYGHGQLVAAPGKAQPQTPRVGVGRVIVSGENAPRFAALVEDFRAGGFPGR